MCSKSSQKGKFDIFGDDKPMNIDEALIRAVADKYGVFSTPSKRKGERGEAYQRRVAANAANRKVVEEALGIKPDPENPKPTNQIPTDDLRIPTKHRIADVPSPGKLTARRKTSVAEVYALFKELAAKYGKYKDHPETLDLAERVFTLADTLGIEVKLYKNNIPAYKHHTGSRNAAGAFLKKANVVSYSVEKFEGAGDIQPEVLFHEFLHSVTSYAIYKYEEGTLPDGPLKDAVRDIVDVYDTIHKKRSNGKHGIMEADAVGPYSEGQDRWYGMKSPSEMVAELANPRFCERLQREGLWEKLVNGFVKLFYPEKAGAVKTDAYKKIHDAVDRMLRNFSYDDINDYAEYADAKAEPIKIKPEKADGAKSKPYDYERYPLGRVAEGLADKKVEIVKVGNDGRYEFNTNQKTRSLKKEVIAAANYAGIIGEMDNAETNGKGVISISNSSIDKMVDAAVENNEIPTDLTLNAIMHLKEIIRNSIEVETHPHFEKGVGHKRNPNAGSNKDVIMHRIYGAIEIKGEIYRVKTTLRETISNETNKAYSLSLDEMKLSKELSRLDNFQPAPNKDNFISAANLLKDVEMSNMPGVKVLDQPGIDAANLQKATAVKQNSGLVKPEECALYIPEPAKEGSAVSRRRQREVIDSKELAMQGALNAAAGAGYQAQNRRGFKYGSTWSEYFVDNANPLARLIRNLTWSRG